MSNSSLFGFCSAVEIQNFISNGQGVAVTLRRACPVPVDFSIWEKDRMLFSFDKFKERFSSLRKNGCKISDSFVLEREEETEFFCLLHSLRIVGIDSICFSVSSSGHETVVFKEESDKKIFEMLFVVRSGLVCLNIPLVESFCSKLRYSDLVVQDARSECMCTLVKSVEMFDPFRSNKFSTYAYTSFNNAFKDLIQKSKNHAKLINDFVEKSSLTDVGVFVEPKMSDTFICASEIIDMVKNEPSVLGLTDVEVKCVMYVIGDDERNLDDKASDLGISRGTLKNRTISALEKIKSHISGILKI